MDEGGPVDFSTLFTRHEQAEDAKIPMSPSVYLSSEDPEEPSSDNPTDKEEHLMRKKARIGAQCWARYRNDHTCACGGALLPVPEQPFQFLALPTEIRLEILQMLLSREKKVTQMPAGIPTTDYERVPVDTRIFAVSSIVKEEAEPVFYRFNTISINPRDPPPLFVQRLAGHDSANFKAAFRSIHLHVIHAQRFCNHHGPRAIWEGMENVSTALKHCTQLKRIEVRLDSWSYVTPWQFEELLTSLAEIRGADIIFTKLSSRLTDNTGELLPRY